MTEPVLLRYTFAKRRRRLLLPFLALLLLSIFVYCFLIAYGARGDVRYCFMDRMPPQEDALNEIGAVRVNVPKRLPDVLLSEEKPTPGGSIFFHETSCHQPPPPGSDSLIGSITGSPPAPASINMVQLNARQACAIESAALHNPNLKVFVLFASTAYADNSTYSSSPLLEAILSYSNVYLRNLNLWAYAANTPMHEWLKDGELFKSKHVLSHISDFLRYLTLWRWGGTYLDMDIVVLRSLEDVPPNYTGAESTTHLAAGVMNFAPTGFGHEVAEKCLHDLQRNFDGDDWGNNGPGVITRVMQAVCGTKNIALMETKRCMGFKVFEQSAFYAIRWPQWEHFFEAQYLEETLEAVKKSYVAHVWNKHSKQRRVKVGSNVAYGKLAEEHCPKVYDAAGEFF